MVSIAEQAARHAGARPPGTIGPAWAGSGAWEPLRALSQSLQGIDAALAEHPHNKDLLVLRAQALQNLGREAESQQTYLQVLQQDPDHAAALSNLGRDLAAKRCFSASRLLLERAVRRHPSHAPSHAALGLLLYEMGEPAGARDALERALQIAPHDQLAHTTMSFVLQSLGEPARAAAHRLEGFRNRTLICQPYKGEGPPLARIVLLAATDRSNAPVLRFLDGGAFVSWVVVSEFHDPAVPLPEHDLLFNLIGDADAASPLLRKAEAIISASGAPVINPPSAVARTGRCENWQRLGQLEAVVVPRACKLPRTALAGPDASVVLGERGLHFPLLLRAPGFHGGDYFERVEDARALPAAVDRLPGEELIAVEYLDTRSADGKTRKYRVMIVDGELHPLHVAVGHQWKLHYFSADMTHSAAHRAEDERFLSDMTGVLGQRVFAALQRISQCLCLDYGGIDFGITAEGNVALFEANATMIVPTPPADACWDYRRAAVARIDAAVRRMLLARVRAGRAPLVAARGSRLPANERNFSAGPGALPSQVLEAAQQAIIALPETGLSVLGMSHRSRWFEQLLEEAERNLRGLLAIPESHAVLFLQGGSSLQFSMVPMNFAPQGLPEPLYVRSGHWSSKAIEEARCVRALRIAWDGSLSGYREMPLAGELATTVPCEAAYLHYVSNETVEGLQMQQLPVLPSLPLIADMSSDLLSRPIDVGAHAMVYAHAQKNLGPAGVTLCLVDKALLDRVPTGIAPMLDFRTHVRCGSNYNTPPVFGIYVLTLVTRWLRDVVGGLRQMEQINRAKAERLYRAIDRYAGLIEPHAHTAFRSSMNVSFRFRDTRLDSLFLEQAAAAGFTGLAGHRSLGGVRASLYNAVPLAAATELAQFLEDFAATHG